MYEIELKPNGKILKWCRENDRKTPEIVADALSLPVDALTSWENGTEEINYSILQKLANIYQRPISFFFLPEPPQEKLISPEFRTFDSVKVDELSPETIFAIRNSKYNRRLYKGLLDELKETYSFDFPRAKVTDDPELFARKIRAYLEIPDDIHSKLKSKPAALRYWITSVERKGLLIFQYTLPECGFCLQGEANLPPVIVLSSAEEPTARAFTIFHELAHLLVLNGAKGSNYTQLEKFCNHFAGAFLVEKELLLESPFYKKYCLESADYWLFRLASEFKVSVDVILRRLLILNKIRQQFYDEKNAEFTAKRDRALKAKKDKEGFLPPAKRSLFNLGITMFSKLFEARDRGVIGTAELVRNFQTTTHTLPNIRAEIVTAKNFYDQ